MPSDLNLQYDRVADIDRKLKSIDTGLDSYFKNYNLQQLEHVINKVDEMKDEHNTMHHKFDHYKSRDINEFMELCNQLGKIRSLVNDKSQDSSLFEKIDNFRKFEIKLNELKDSIQDGIQLSDLKIISELDQKIGNDRKSLTDEAQIYFEKYVLLTTDELIVYDEIDKQPFSKTLNTIRSFCGESFSDVVKLTKQFQDWLDSAFVQLDNGKSLIFDSDTNKNMLKIVDSSTEFSEFAKSVKQIILFMNEIAKYTENIKELANIRPIIGKQLLKEIRSRIFRKENVYPLIIDKLNYEEGSKISDISKLYEISNMLTGPGWSRDGICELEFWIDDLSSFWVNNLVDYTIDDIKQFVREFLTGEYEDRLKDHNLVIVELGGDKKQTPKEQEKDNEDWENNWEEKDDWNEDEKKNGLTDHAPVLEGDIDDDDGWGNDEDLDLDSINDAKENIEEDGWDAWNEEVDLSDNELGHKDVVKEKYSALLNPSYKHTTLVGDVLGIFAKYYNNFSDLSRFEVNKEQLGDIQELFKQGFKKLCTAYFMMIQSDVPHTYKNHILFYNDFSKLVEECSLKYEIDLGSCYKLNLNYLNEYIDDYTEKLIHVISKYSDSIWGDNVLTNSEINEESYKFMNEFDLNLETVLLEVENSTSLNTQLVANLVVTLIFKTLNIICNKLISRNDISSYESSILSEIIDHTIEVVKTNLNKLGLSTGNIQSLVKLEQIRLILLSNLKEILEAFYDAKFYELETFELTSLIKSLFVDSMQRDQIIQEITTLREDV